MAARRHTVRKRARESAKPSSMDLYFRVIPPNKRDAVKSLREIRKLQTSTDLSIPKRDFQNLVREVCRKVGIMDYRFKRSALDALQEAAEDVLVTEFYCKLLAHTWLTYSLHHAIVSNQEAIHAKRVTLQIKDMEMVQKIRRGLVGYGKPGENGSGM
jgi:histone H3